MYGIHEIQGAFGRTRVVERQHEWVPQPRQNLDLAVEALGAEGNAMLGAENLQRYVTIVANVAREVDSGHAAAPSSRWMSYRSARASRSSDGTSELDTMRGAGRERKGKVRKKVRADREACYLSRQRSRVQSNTVPQPYSVAVYCDGTVPLP